MIKHIDQYQVKFSPHSDASGCGVDLWLLDLSIYSETSPDVFRSRISPEEFEYSTKISHNPKHFLATRSFLRTVLSGYTRCNPLDLQFSKSAHGKPYLTNDSQLFNLSHTEDLAILAVTRLADIGVDVERIRERDYLKIAKRYFHSAEVTALASCLPEDQGKLFFRYWTLKEAFFKAMGGGISTGLNKVCFEFAAEKVSAQIDDDLDQSPKNWQFYLETLAQDIQVAVAINSNQPLSISWFLAPSLTD